MRTLIIILVILLVVGPLRKPLLWGWRIVVPLAVGAVIGHVAVTRLMHGAPGWMLIVGPMFGAFIVGGAVKELIDTVTRK